MREVSVDPVPDLIRSRNSRGRCVYHPAAKRELVRRCLQPGVSLARLALDHGVNANLLRKWVIKQTGVRAPRRQRLLPAAQVPLLAVRTTTLAPSAPVRAEGYLELIVAGGTIRVHGRVEAETLSLALDCLARRA